MIKYLKIKYKLLVYLLLVLLFLFLEILKTLWKYKKSSENDQLMTSAFLFIPPHTPGPKNSRKSTNKKNLA